MSLALIVLSLSAFAIGTTEFVIMGLLPDVARDLSVTIPMAGWLVTGYALSVAVGAPLMAVATARLERRQALRLLMVIFVLGNVLCALAASYGLLMLARVVTALCHGAFFGIGSVVATSVVPADRRASAIAIMFTGLTLANILGVPLGTALGQEFGWRMTFWAVSVIGVLALAGLMFSLPEDAKVERETLRSEMTVLRHREVWQAFAMTVTFSAAMFTTFTYIAPFLEDLTGLSPRGVTSSLFLIGVGLTIGNVLGGRFADKRLQTTLIGGFAAIAVASLLLSVFATMMIPTEILLFVWGCVTFALVPALQVNVMKRGHEAPNLVSIMNIGAFNIGNALGAWTGGAVLDAEFGLQSVPVAAVVWAVAGVLLSLRRKEVAVTQI
jgi:DHA1 family inner membrane transport protein